MARRVVFEASVSRTAASVWTGLAGALAFCFALFTGLNLYLGDQVPRELEGTTPWFGAATVAVSALTAWLWWRSRRPLRVVEIDGVQVLEIDDRPPVLVQGPFRIRTGWHKVRQAKGPALTQLQVVFYDGDRVPLVLVEYWGALYGAPGWDEGVVYVDAEAAYCPSGTRMLTDLVDQLDRT